MAHPLHEGLDIAMPPSPVTRHAESIKARTCGLLPSRMELPGEYRNKSTLHAMSANLRTLQAQEPKGAQEENAF